MKKNFNFHVFRSEFKGSEDQSSKFKVGHTIMLRWEMPSKNIFFIFCFGMDTLKGSSAQIQNLTGVLTGPNLS